MGQQQLLLIVLGVIVVGIAVIMGIVVFSANALDQERNELINEATIIASEAQIYYKKLKVYGGGGNSFDGWKIHPSLRTTEAGHFSENITSSQEVIITATGKQTVTGSDTVKVQVKVTPDEYVTTIIN